MKDKILKLFNGGKSYNQICEKLGCSKATVSYYCNPEGRSKNNERVAKFREQVRNEIKMAFGGKCKVCGYSRCLQCLSFHHRDPSIKEDKISSMINSRGKKAAFEEAKKCVLLCCRCHGELHAGMITI